MHGAGRVKRQHRKMVKHTQTIRRQNQIIVLSVVDHFVGLVLKGLRTDRWLAMRM